MPYPFNRAAPGKGYQPPQPIIENEDDDFGVTDACTLCADGGHIIISKYDFRYMGISKGSENPNNVAEVYCTCTHGRKVQKSEQERNK